MRSTQGFPRLHIPQPDPLAGLLTPSRDHWRAVVFEEVLELLESSGLTEREKAEQIMHIVEREQTRSVGEER